MIKIFCERDRLQGWEKIRYAKGISVVIRKLREFQQTIKKEKAVEVDYLITMK